MIVACCSDRPRMADSEEDLKSMLAEAFREGDTSLVGSLMHPSTDKELKDEMLKFIQPWFDFKPAKVTPSIIQLADVPFPLPGELNGRTLKYTTSIDGVVFLDGRSPSEHGEEKVGLYFSFTKTAEGYCLTAAAYDD